MCFAIPYKVLQVQKNTALIENGQRIVLGNEIKVKKGDYLQILGNIAVGSISKTAGVRIRKLIKNLNT